MALINGTPNDDTLVGTSGDDTIHGGAGNDELTGNGGNDVITGDEGDDFITVGYGHHDIDGGSGSDTLHLIQPGPDPDGYIDGYQVDLRQGGTFILERDFGYNGGPGYSRAAGIENVSGSLGGDVVWGTAGANILAGEENSDTLIGGAGDDLLLGDGRIRISNGQIVITETGVGSGDDTLSGGDGNDRLVGGEGIDLLFGGTGNDTLEGNSGIDFLNGGSGNDTLAGGEDDDTLHGFTGDDLLDGGTGVDTVSYANTDPALGGVTASLLVQGTPVNMGAFGMDTLVSIENLGGSSFSDNLTGTDGPNWLFGGVPVDVNGSPSTNNDTVYGLGGNDFLEMSFGDHSLDGGSGIDTLSFTDGRSSFPENYYVYASLTLSLALQGGAQASGAGSWTLTGIENLSGWFSNDQLTGDANANVLAGSAGSDTLTGGAGDDLLLGDGQFLISGGQVILYESLVYIPLGAYVAIEGNDVLDGGEGNDRMVGGRHNDIYYVDSAGDVVVEQPGEGTDEIRTGLSAYSLAALPNVENLTGLSGAGQSLTGNGLANVIAGGSGGDTLDGGAGADQLTGGAGNDVYLVDDAGDAVIELAGGGSDEIRTALASYSLVGLDNIENLTGLGGVGQTLTGNGANNVIDGGGGSDILRGGAGNDSLKVSGIGQSSAEGGANFDTLIVNYGDAAGNITMGFPNADPNGGYVGSLGNGGDRRVDYSSVDNFNITTGSGNDTIWGGVNANTASLGGGDDVFIGMGGFDTADGGAGEDGVTAALGLATTAIVWDLAANSYSGPIGSYTNFEYFGGLLTGSADDVIVTTSANRGDQISLGSGNDRATVVNGHDSVNGEFGNDLLVIDYSAATASVTTTSGAAGIAAGSDNSGILGQIGDGGTRRVDFNNIDRFDVRTGSGDDNIVLGTQSLITNDIVSLGGGNDVVDFGRGLDQGDGGAGIDGLAVDLSGTAVAVRIDLVANTWSGPAGTSFTNFEYLGSFSVTGFQTGSGNDVVRTANVNRNDNVTLGAGDDIVIFYDGNDNVLGGAGSDGLTNTGSDTLILSYGAATAAVHNVGAIQTTSPTGASGQFGDDSTRLATFMGIDHFLISTGSGNDNLTTAGGDDELHTGAGNDILATMGGNDTLDGGIGADSMTGGLGDDYYYVDDAGDSVNENANEGIDEVRTALAAYSIAGLANVENLTGISTGAQDLRGNGGNNVVTGAGGNDFIRLQDGGADTGIGGGGNDVFLFGASLTSADKVDGGAGTDQIAIQGDYSGGVTLGAQLVSIESLAILSSTDNRFGGGGAGPFDYRITTVDQNVAAGATMVVDANLLQAGEDFTFDGSAESDGSFFTYGSRGVDDLTGGAKNDAFYFGEGLQFGASDKVNGGPGGTDQLGLRGNYTIVFGASQLTSIESIGLVSAKDTRYGALGSNYNYNLTMNDGNVAAGQRMTVDGAPLRSTETLTFDGSGELDGSFRVFGGAGDDVIRGSHGNDVLSGGMGTDMLYGNAGNDVFLYRSVGESTAASRDRIQDFALGDKVDLSGIDAIAGTPANDGFTLIGANGFSGVAGQLRYENTTGNIWVVQGDTNGDGLADIELVIVAADSHQLTSGDFFG